MLPLGQFNEYPAPRKKGIGETLLERAKSILTFFQGSAEFHAVCFPFTTCCLNIINLKGKVLHALPILLDELADLRLHRLISTPHERYLRVPSLHHDGIHRRLVAAHIAGRPDNVKPKNFGEENLCRFEVLHAERDVINPCCLVHDEASSLRRGIHQTVIASSWSASDFYARMHYNIYLQSSNIDHILLYYSRKDRLMQH